MALYLYYTILYCIRKIRSWMRLGYVRVNVNPTFSSLCEPFYSVYVAGAFVVVVVIILYTTDGGSGVTDKSVSEYYKGHNGTDPVLKIRFII